MTATVFDPRPCTLGEGALWHPERGQLFWFDILGRRLLSRREGKAYEWAFADPVSAAGWLDEDSLIVASSRALLRFEIATGEAQPIADLEAGNSITRSNDGRADPWGGFWIGTMGLNAEPGAGAIYRFYQGRLHRLYAGLTIPNAICFSPDQSCAYFTDTVTGVIKRQPLDGEGWPIGESDIFVDLRAEGLNPDGAVVDQSGNLWNAQWGASRVACYAPDGTFLHALEIGASQASCPAFGGEDLRQLFVTSAAEGLAAQSDPLMGQTFVAQTEYVGQREHQVRLG